MGTEDGHQEDERPDRSRGDEIVLAGAAKGAIRQEPDREDRHHVEEDDSERHGESSPSASRWDGQAKRTTSAMSAAAAARQ